MANNVHIVRLLIIFSFLIVSKISFPQGRDYDVESITTQDGLANGCISMIIQDSKGFMWFATEGGLNRYDGYNIKLYDCGQKVIKTIFEDPTDSGKALWIGTIGGGLLKFNRNSERFIQYQYNADDPNSISNNNVWCIYKDRSGIYWIGTEGGGLNSFDRNTGKFISYRNNPNDTTSISSDFVYAICEDYLDNLWVGNHIGGLDRFDRNTNKFIHYKYAPSDSTKWGLHHIRSLYEDSEKTLWIGTSFTLFKYDRENDQFIKPVFNEKSKQFSTYNNIFSIIEDKEKTLWIASHIEGVTGISSDRRYFKYSSKEMNSFNSSSVCIDQSGIIWEGTYCQGVNKIIPRKKYFNHYKYTLTDSTNLKFHWTQSFFEDKKDDLWIGTNEGLRKLEYGKLIYYPNLIDGIARPIFTVCQSITGKLWLTCRGCLTEFDPQTKKYINYEGKYIVYSSPVINLIENLVKDSSEIASIKKVTNNQNLTKDFIIDKSTPVIVLCTGEGNLSELFDYGWISMAGDENPIWKMNPESSRNFGGSFKNRDQISLLTLKPGKYRLHYQSDDKHAFGNWIGKAPSKPELWGISVFPISHSVYQTYKNEIEKINYIPLHFTDLGDVVEDNEGRVWGALSTEENTVHYFDQETKQFVPYPIIIDGQSFPNIERIYKDHSGMLWFNTHDNILIRKDFDGKCGIKFVLEDFMGNKKSKLNNNAISQVYEDSRGNFWVGTDIGLFEYNLSSEKINHHKSADFNLPNTIEGIVEDNNGTLWISTSKNLIKFDPGQNRIQKYDGRDGLPDIKFARNSFIKLKDGRLAFGGSIGFIIFHPDSIKDNEVPPEIAITGFQIFNKLIEAGEDSPLKKAISESDKIVLNYDQDVFTFEFSALDFQNPEKNKYAYKMKGVDPDWVYTDANRRFATYTKLDPGNYVFTVKGSNNDGIWNESGKSILVIITPPWWKTWWAYTSYAAILIFALYGLRRYELNRVSYKNQGKLDKAVLKEKEETEKIKSTFFANISHEFRTPLTLILGPAEKIEKNESANSVKDAGIITRNSKRLLQLVNQLLDLSKLDSAKLKLEASPGNIVSFIKGHALSFESLSESRDIMLKIKSDKEFIEVYFDKEKMFKSFSNLLSNAFKFTPEMGNVIITITETLNNTAEIKIRNTGIGISQKELPKLFDRFYQVDSSQTKEYEGTGIGLALTKELVELHHGSITVDSENGKWTEFTINLPLGRAHLKDEEILTNDETNAQKEIAVEEEEYYNLKNVSESDAVTDESKTIILVVEDNYDMREYIKESLSDSYVVEEAVNGEQGVRIAEKIIPDLIISDLMMPKMDGNELTRILKNDERTSHIPIIILTAKSGQANKIEGLQTGADDYLTKPFDLQELQVRVENLISIRKKLQEKFSKGEFLYKPSGEKIKSIDEKFLIKIIKVIEKHLSEENFSIEECGSEIGMSRTHLYKKVKALVGKSPSQYVRTVRLTHAKKMIEEGKGNISEIAYTVGFSSPAYFSRCFKEEFGYPPSNISS